MISLFANQFLVLYFFFVVIYILSIVCFRFDILLKDFKFRESVYLLPFSNLNIMIVLFFYISIGTASLNRLFLTFPLRDKRYPSKANDQRRFSFIELQQAEIVFVLDKFKSFISIFPHAYLSIFGDFLH